ncbi:MAG TPA: hypothetical protein VGC92_09495, partial [Phenylobacterium sp.]
KGSNQVSVLATARILSLQARTDEMLTLVARGTADDKETAFVGGTAADGTPVPSTEKALADSLATAHRIATDDTGRQLADSASDDEAKWNTLHKELRGLDQQNQYQKAVDSALGEHDYAPPKDSAAQSFNNLQDDLDKAIAHAEDSFRAEAKSAAGALTGLQIGLGVLAAAIAAAVVLGLGRRLAEYH